MKYFNIEYAICSFSALWCIFRLKNVCIYAILNFIYYLLAFTRLFRLHKSQLYRLEYKMDQKNTNSMHIIMFLRDAVEWSVNGPVVKNAKWPFRFLHTIWFESSFVQPHELVSKSHSKTEAKTIVFSHIACLILCYNSTRININKKKQVGFFSLSKTLRRRIIANFTPVDSYQNVVW